MAYNYSTPPEQIICQEDIEIEELQQELMKKRLKAQSMHKITFNQSKDFLDELLKFEFNEDTFKLVVVADSEQDVLISPMTNTFKSKKHNQLFYSDVGFEESDSDTRLEFSEQSKRCIHSTPTPQLSYNDSRKCSISSDLSVDTVISPNNIHNNLFSDLQNYSTYSNKRNFESFWQDYGYNDPIVQSPLTALKKRKLRNINNGVLENVPRLQSPVLLTKKS